MNNFLPNFLIVGAAKSGTTSIYNYIKQHPQLFLSDQVKESYYWIEPKEVLGNGKGYLEKDVIADFKQYENLFSSPMDRSSIKAVGEICNGYLYFHKYCIENIRRTLGDVKIIIVLRNPVERAYSGYLHLIREGIVDETFKECLGQESERIKSGYWWAFHVFQIGMYGDAVKNYLDNFTNVSILYFDDFIINQIDFYKKLFNFLDVEDSFVSSANSHYNKTGIPKNKLLWRLLRTDSMTKRVAKKFVNERIINFIKNFLNKNIIKPELDINTYNYLWNKYLPDIEKLEQLTQHNIREQWTIN